VQGLGIGVCIEESICDTTGIISRLLWIPKGITLADSTQVARSHRNARSGLGFLYVDTGKGVCIARVSSEGSRGADSRLLRQEEIRVGMVQSKLVRIRVVISLEDPEQ